jgi:hypothetical protein
MTAERRRQEIVRRPDGSLYDEAAMRAHLADLQRRQPERARVARLSLIDRGIAVFDRPAGRVPDSAVPASPRRGASGDESASSEAIDVPADPSPGAGGGFAAWTVAGDLTSPS